MEVRPPRIAGEPARRSVHWLCDGQVAESEPGLIDTTCPQGETCVAGRCVTAVLESEKLPVFEAPDVFGGGHGSGDGVCIDVVGCFDTGFSVSPDLDACTVALPAEEGARRCISDAAWQAGDQEGDCFPYRCQDGECLEVCESDDECALGRVCEAPRCVRPSVAPVGDDDAGCGCSIPGASARRSGALLLWAIVVLCVARARRGRRMG